MSTTLDNANDDIALALGREFLSNIIKDRFLKQQAEQLATQAARLKELEDHAKDAEAPATDTPAE